MKIAIPKERHPDETRVAGSPEVVKKLTDLGFDVVVEKGAGAGASFSDAEFKQAGATIAKDERTALKTADIVFKVRRPIIKQGLNEVAMMKKGALLLATIYPTANRKDVEAYAKAGISAFAMELMPRISRAQSMDVLSSQSNLAGYKSVLDAASEFGRAFPMMMTAAGTIAPAKVFVLGVGVAGLQAIATSQTPGRRGHRLRCAPGGQGASGEPGAASSSRSIPKRPRTRKPPAVMPRKWAPIF